MKDAYYVKEKHVHATKDDTHCVTCLTTVSRIRIPLLGPQKAETDPWVNLGKFHFFSNSGSRVYWCYFPEKRHSRRVVSAFSGPFCCGSQNLIILVGIHSWRCTVSLSNSQLQNRLPSCRVWVTIFKMRQNRYGRRTQWVKAWKSSKHEYPMYDITPYVWHHTLCMASHPMYDIIPYVWHHTLCMTSYPASDGIHYTHRCGGCSTLAEWQAGRNFTTPWCQASRSTHKSCHSCRPFSKSRKWKPSTQLVLQSMGKTADCFHISPACLTKRRMRRLRSHFGMIDCARTSIGT